MKPNILFIQADQLTASFLGAYGNAIVKTPNIDALAERSAVFDSAYCNFPLCAPSRFSMMSGRLASKIGAYDNGAEFPSSIPTFAHYLRAAGYQSSLVGKMHFVGADQLHGFEERLTTDIYPADFNWTGDWTETTPEFANDARSFKQAGVCARNVQMDYDEEVCYRASRKLYDLARSDDDRPFFVLTSFTHPHDPYQCSPEYWDRYHHDDIDMPVVSRLPDTELDPYSQRLMALSGLDRYVVDEAETRRARHAYYGSVSYLDDLVGKLLSVLSETGLDANTAIVFTTDHGDNLGERGLWYKKNFFEASAHIPLIICMPGQLGQRITQHVSLVDLAPTLIELAGEQPDEFTVEPLDGKSLIGLMSDNDAAWPQNVYAEILAEGAAAPQIMIRNKQYKYIYSGCDPELLYDLEQDPNERHNCIAEPGLSNLVEEFRAQIVEKWDIPSLTQDIVLSQKRRLFLRKALHIGKFADWDFVATDQVAQQCLRSDQVYNEWAYSQMLDLNTEPELTKSDPNL